MMSVVSADSPMAPQDHPGTRVASRTCERRVIHLPGAMTVFGLKQVGYVARLARGCANFSVCGRREATGHVAGLED